MKRFPTSEQLRLLSTIPGSRIERDVEGNAVVLPPETRSYIPSHIERERYGRQWHEDYLKDASRARRAKQFRRRRLIVKFRRFVRWINHA